MEASITEGFLKNIEEAGKRYTQQVEKLSQQYAAAIQAIRTVPEPDSIEQRLSHQFQKDIGDLNTRVLKIERDRHDNEYEDGLGAWITSPEFEFLSEGLQNEVVNVPEAKQEEEVRKIVVQLDNGDIEMQTAAVTEVPAVKEEAKEEAKEAKEEEEEEEQLELEELEYEDKMYYKDGENNVYSANDDGEVNETPVGRWIEKRKVVKFY